MKKILAFLLAVSMILAMAACAAAPAQTTTETAQTEQTEQTPAAEPAAEEPASEPAAPAEEESLTETQKIIKEAEGLSLEDLAKKAIEESNGTMFYGVGNSSRGKSALPLFIEYLQSIDPSYSMEFEWQQPKNNKIFDQLTADSLKDTGTFAMTLIQDGNQIESKMVQTGILDTFIRYMQNTIRRMTEQPCELPEGGTEERAVALIRVLGEIGALELLEE